MDALNGLTWWWITCRRQLTGVQEGGPMDVLTVHLHK